MYYQFNDSYQTKNHNSKDYGDTPQELVLRYYPEARPLNKIALCLDGVINYVLEV